jgi:hypothetical protein
MTLIFRLEPFTLSNGSSVHLKDIEVSLSVHCFIDSPMFEWSIWSPDSEEHINLRDENLQDIIEELYRGSYSWYSDEEKKQKLSFLKRHYQIK